MLYNDYRSATFLDVVGQKHITEGLCKKVEINQVPHALLFVGIRGVGKTSIAKILAKAINCLDPQMGEPCNKCSSCLEISKEASIDYHEIDAASNNGVDTIRQIKNDVQHQPLSKYKVYIIDEVHMLSNSAFNALLKTLEEPPKNVIFILATTEFNKIPATIVSRCQTHTFKRITASDIAGRLKYILEQEKIGFNNDAIKLIADQADGSMRDGISILDACIEPDTEITLDSVKTRLGIISYARVSQLLSYLLSSDCINALNTLEGMYNDGIDLRYIVQSCIKMVKDCMRYVVSKTSIDASVEYLEIIETLSNKVSITILTDVLDKFNELKKNKEIMLIDLESFIIKTGFKQPLESSVAPALVEDKKQTIKMSMSEEVKSILSDFQLKIQVLEEKLENYSKQPIHSTTTTTTSTEDKVIKDIPSEEIDVLINDFKKTGPNQKAFKELEKDLFVTPLCNIDDSVVLDPIPVAEESINLKNDPIATDKEIEVKIRREQDENVFHFDEIKSEEKSVNDESSISLAAYVEQLMTKSTLRNFLEKQEIDISLDSNKIEIMTKNPVANTVLLALKEKKSKVLQYHNLKIEIHYMKE